MKKVTIEFDNSAAASHFMSWLSGSGEQEYWMWMEEQECNEGGKITAIRFRYSSEESKITTECGRLSDR